MLTNQVILAKATSINQILSNIHQIYLSTVLKNNTKNSNHKIQTKLMHIRTM